MILILYNLGTKDKVKMPAFFTIGAVFSPKYFQPVVG
jgi:hypothetical protein